MAKKFYKFVGKLDEVNKVKMPLQQKQILRAMHDLTKNNKVQRFQGAQIVDHAKEKFNLETRQKSTVLFAWYARDNEARGYAEQVE
jgi:hypothetical protein